MSHATRVARKVAAAAALALPAVPAAAVAQDARPIVVVFTFKNSSVGKGAADFAGMETGVQDLLITDMASNARIRLVDRTHINDILQEQGMVKNGQVDPATAVKLGKIMGAQYAILGGFMSDGNGKAVLTGRTVDVETTESANPEKIEGKPEDVFGLINQLSSRLAANMKLAPKPGRRVGEAGDGGSAAKPAPAQTGAAKSAPADDVEKYAKPVSTKSMETKVDAATLKLYSQALDEIDRKNTAKAKTLLKQVLTKYDGWEPAKRQLDKLG
jgi:TolB-like protein